MMRFWSLTGLTAYADARELQLRLVELRAADLIPDTVLFLEHEPVITRGQGLQFTGEERPRHMPIPVLPPGIAFSESERGGDLTCHGPGQLVIYPICKLDGKGFSPHHDVTGFIRRLEGLLIKELEDWGLTGESLPMATGVWVNGHKVASLGIAVRKWVIYHGMAINCINDLAPFHLISPCGFDPAVMARLMDFQPPGWGDQNWRTFLTARLATRFLANSPDLPNLVHLTCDEALEMTELGDGASSRSH